jgi:protein sprouty family protein 2
MALHGSPGPRNADAATPLPRVHVTPRSAAAAAASGLLPLLPRRSPPEVVSLAQPRPDGERAINEYVEAPLRGGESLGLPPPRPGRHPPVAPGLAHRSNTSYSPSTRLPLPTAASKRSSGGVVTKQPTSSYKKDTRGNESSTCPPSGLAPTICPECGKCRCEMCRGPRPLPERWLFNNKVYCSPGATVDYISCLCCVRALFYHCSKDYERDDGSAPCADEPCSCASPRRCARWGCLAALSLGLPCLLCYWPLRGCLAGFEACHERVTSNRGCRCRDRPPPTVSAMTAAAAASSATNKSLLDGSAADKRLLDSSPDA